jgi:hypothetical protein
VKKILSSLSLTAVLTFFLTAFIGQSGWLWEWRKTGTDQAKYELEKTKQALEVREKLEANILKVLEIHKNSDNVGREKDPIKNEQLSREVRMEWKYKFPTIKNNIDQLESILAKLENREPRSFDFQPTPYNLRVFAIP